MTLHADLLAQAVHLARLERRRPKQASLRRAVSTAYYALFHLISAEAANRLVRGHDREFHRNLVRRALSHNSMLEASKAFASGTLPRSLVTPEIDVSQDVREVAATFVYLQQQRHDADYNLLSPFTGTRAENAILRADDASRAWQRARGGADADLYLLALLLSPPR